MFQTIQRDRFRNLSLWTSGSDRCLDRLALEERGQLMYGMFGGCSTLFHLAVKHPIVVLVLGLASMTAQVQANPGPGDRLGTENVLMQTQNDIVDLYPGLPTEVRGIRMNFDATVSSSRPTEDQVNQVLKYTDACTDASAKGVLSDPTDRTEAAWLLYLNRLHLERYAREGPRSGEKLFVGSPPTPIQRK